MKCHKQITEHARKNITDFSIKLDKILLRRHFKATYKRKPKSDIQITHDKSVIVNALGTWNWGSISCFTIYNVTILQDFLIRSSWKFKLSKEINRCVIVHSHSLCIMPFISRSTFFKTLFYVFHNIRPARVTNVRMLNF